MAGPLPVPARGEDFVRSAACGGFVFTESWHAADSRIPSHAHGSPSLTLVLCGGFEEQATDLVTAVPGGALTRTAGAAHTDRIGPQGSHNLTLEIVGGAERWDVLAARLRQDVQWWRDERLRRLALRMRAELKASDEPRLLALEALALELLAILARDEGGAATQRPAWLESVREVLHARSAERIGLAELAAASGLHASTLARGFRRHFGMTPGAYQRRLRLQAAAGQISGTDLPLAEIARAAGFTDQSHFTKGFVAAFGTTPGAYRRESR